MSRIDASLARLALSPVQCLSGDRLPSSYTALCTRAVRIMNLPLLRRGLPPAGESQRQSLVWVMSGGEQILTGVVQAAVMVQSRVMRRLLVSGSLREQLTSILGMERLTEALRYSGEDVLPVSDGCDLEELRSIGYAVMYRHVRLECLELSRRLLRSMDRDDPCLVRAVGWIRRLQGHFCAEIGAKVVSGCEAVKAYST